MRIAVSADWQFAEYLNLSTTLPSGIPSRLEEQFTAWKWYIDEAHHRDCSALVVNGDIFDSRTSLSLAEIDVVSRCFQLAANKFGADNVHVVVGNHDSWLRGPTVTSLRMLSGVANVWDTPGAAGLLGFVPWYDSEAELGSAVTNLLRTQKGVVYLFTHCIVKGMFPNGKGVDRSVFEHKQLRRVLLGDVHDRIIVTPKIRYIGAPMQFNYGDAGKPRGFGILDTTTDAYLDIDNEFSRRFFVVERESDLAEVRPDDYVRVAPTDEEDGNAELIVAAARKMATHVESKVVTLDDPPPRLAVKSSDPHGEVLDRWLERYQFDDATADRRRALGLSLLEEAQS